MSVYVIAEAGISAEGYTSRAESMIVSAKCAGADCIKWQAFIPKLTAQGNAEFEKILTRTYFGKEQLAHLKEICAENEIDFLCSAFEEENLDWLADIGETRVKIPSCRNTNKKFLQLACEKFKQVFISTGMMTEKQVKNLWTKHCFDKDFFLLYCVSAYPCPFEQFDLRLVEDAWYSGISDHTVGWEVPVAAVALGAQIIEKHFTLGRDGGVDDCVSLEPDEFADMVRRIRNVEKAMGSGIKKVMPCEKKLIWRKK